jgi:YfiH family protein
MSLPDPMPPFRWTPTPWGHALVCDALPASTRHVFTARGLDVPHPEAGAGWARLAEHLGVAEADVWRLHQVHGVTAHTDGVARSRECWPEGDLLATDRTDVAVSVRTADCVPLLYADERTGVVAAVHAGWRGTVAGAAARMVAILATRFGTNPADLVVALGPSIGPEAYEVGHEVVEAFGRAWPEDAARGTWWRSAAEPGKYLLDLWTATRDQLAAAGVRPEHMHLAGLCTATHADVFESFRVNGAAAGRMAAAIRRVR